MTKAEMEEAIKNHERRLVNVEQILPTLATKADLAELKQHTSVQFEALRDDIRMLAEALAVIPAKFDEVNARFDRMDQRFARMDQRFDRMDQRFDRMDARFDRLEGRADATAGGLETLTRRLTERGVI